MQLTCPSCQQTIAAENVNLDRAIAKCSACNAVFSFVEQFSQGQSESDRVRQRPLVALPKGILLHDSGTSLSIFRRWFQPLQSFFFLFFCLFWDGFLVVWFAIALSAEDIPWMMVLFPLLHVAAGVVVTYYTLALFFNTTTIFADYQTLRVSHKPLPWPGQNTFERSDIEQLYSKEKIHRSKNGVSYTYEVRILKKDRTQRALLAGLQNTDQALYIEQELERYFRIRDRPVPGELPR